MKCKKCGAKIDSSDRFCRLCGYPNEKNSGQQSENSAGRCSRRKFVVAVLIIILMVSAVLLFRWRWGSGDSASESSLKPGNSSKSENPLKSESSLESKSPLESESFSETEGSLKPESFLEPEINTEGSEIETSDLENRFETAVVAEALPLENAETLHTESDERETGFRTQNNEKPLTEKESLDAVTVSCYDACEEMEQNGTMTQGEYTVIQGLSENKEVVWEYRTETSAPIELQSFTDIGIRGEMYYFSKAGNVTALDLRDGSVLWVNEGNGASNSFDFSEDGVLYIGSSYGPVFSAIDCHGETLCRIDSFDGRCWVNKVEYMGSYVAVTIEAVYHVDMYVPETVYEVDLKDYSYKIQESSIEIPENAEMDMLPVFYTYCEKDWTELFSDKESVIVTTGYTTAEEFWYTMHAFSLYDWDKEVVSGGKRQYSRAEMTEIAYGLFGDFAGNIPEIPEDISASEWISCSDDVYTFMLADSAEKQLVWQGSIMQDDGSMKIDYILQFYNESWEDYANVSFHLIPNIHVNPERTVPLYYTVDEIRYEKIIQDSVAFGESYLIPDSDKRYLTDEDTRGLSLQQINYAKNEIYARRGRKFVSRELTEYFLTRPWYNGIYEGTDFDSNLKSFLNDYEIMNGEFLSSVEHQMSSEGYRLDQPGYDITAVWNNSSSIEEKLEENPDDPDGSYDVSDFLGYYYLDTDASIFEEYSFANPEIMELYFNDSGMLERKSGLYYGTQGTTYFYSYDTYEISGNTLICSYSIVKSYFGICEELPGGTHTFVLSENGNLIENGHIWFQNQD